MTDVESALAGRHADLEAVADLTPQQLHYLIHADQIEDEATGLECTDGWDQDAPLAAPGEVPDG